MLVAPVWSALRPGGIALVNILAALTIVLVCFLAGMVAQSARGKRIFQTLETVLLEGIPGYAFVKGITDGVVSSDKAAEGFLPVLAKFDDSVKLGFAVEQLEKGKVVIYLPGAPNPWSGSVVYMDKSRITRIDATAPELLRVMRKLGRGSKRYTARLKMRIDQQQ